MAGFTDFLTTREENPQGIAREKLGQLALLAAGEGADADAALAELLKGLGLTDVSTAKDLEISLAGMVKQIEEAGGPPQGLGPQIGLPATSQAALPEQSFPQFIQPGAQAQAQPPQDPVAGILNALASFNAPLPQPVIPPAPSGRRGVAQQAPAAAILAALGAQQGNVAPIPTLGQLIGR